MNQLEFENELLAAITSGSSPGLERLKKQFDNAAVESREMTGVGFFVHYNVAKSRVAPFTKDFIFGDIDIKVDGLDFGAGVVIFIKDGYITCMECYAFGDGWPNTYENVEFSYDPFPRDLSVVEEAL